MKKLLALLFCLAFAISVSAESPQSVIDETIHALGDKIITEEFLQKAPSVQCDWYIIALSKYAHNDNYSAYLSRVWEYVSQKYAQDGTLDKVKATQWQRISLAINAAGGCAESFGEYMGAPINLAYEGTYNARVSFDNQGSNAWIWALRTINELNLDEPQNPIYTKEEIIKRTIEAIGEDTDLTAMALAALAPHREIAEVRAAIDRGISYLKAAELSNCENVAQTMQAYCALSMEDEAQNLFDTLLQYQSADKRFAHTVGAKANDISTAQSLCAFIDLYSLQKKAPEPTPLPTEATTEEATQTEATEVTEASESTEAFMEIVTPNDDTHSREETLWIVLLCVFAAALFMAFFKSKKLFIALLFILLLLFAVTRIKSVEDYNARSEGAAEVRVSVTCKSALENKADLDSAITLPPSGVMIDNALCYLPYGASVREALVAACAQEKIIADIDNSYVRSIGGLYEFSCGSESGWMYRVDGTFPDLGCDEVKIFGGENIEFIYTCKLGRDMK